MALKEHTMSQIHKRFSGEQIRVLFQGYCQGQFSRSNLQELPAVEALGEWAPHVGVDWPLLVVDGFDHFTEVQLGLLKALAAAWREASAVRFNVLFSILTIKTR